MNLETPHTNAARRMGLDPGLLLILLNRPQNRLAQYVDVPAELYQSRRPLRLGLRLSQLFHQLRRWIIPTDEVGPHVPEVAEDHPLLI